MAGFSSILGQDFMDAWTTLWQGGLLNQQPPPQVGQTMSLSALQGEPIHRNTPFLVFSYLRSHLPFQ